MKTNDELFIGVDIGTSSCKAVAVTSSGAAAASARAEYPIYRGADGSAEQDAEDYRRALFEALSALRGTPGYSPERVRGIGVVGQTPTEIFVGGDGVPLRRAITWQDVRAKKEASEIAERFTEDELFAILGGRVPVSPSWSASRLRMIASREPETACLTRKILQPKDYANFVLTGEYFSDNWSCKSLANLADGSVSEKYLGFLGFPASVVPRLGKPFEIMASTTRAVEEATGIPSGTPVTAGWSDALAAMLTSGAFSGRAGKAFNCTGTSEIIGISASENIFARTLMTVPLCVTGTNPVVYGPTQSGSGSLAWLCGILGEGDVARAVNEAVEVPAGAEGLTFLPYLSGERAPLWDPSATGSFTGVRASHDRRHFVRAALEGVACSVRHCLAEAERLTGLSASSLRLTGGGSRQRAWCQIRADMCGIPVELSSTDEAVAVGAASLAAVGAGACTTADIPERFCPSGGSVEPDASKREVYDELFERYKATYLALKSIG